MFFVFRFGFVLCWMGFSCVFAGQREGLVRPPLPPPAPPKHTQMMTTTHLPRRDARDGVALERRPGHREVGQLGAFWRLGHVDALGCVC
jgi:hypothetical protein